MEHSVTFAPTEATAAPFPDPPSPPIFRFPETPTPPTAHRERRDTTATLGVSEFDGPVYVAMKRACGKRTARILMWAFVASVVIGIVAFGLWDRIEKRV